MELSDRLKVLIHFLGTYNVRENADEEMISVILKVSKESDFVCDEICASL